ncbi:radical SAM protein, partial [Myxococcota bacterium]|nr:radical SAM protein [Myxococcota bacterium]
LGYFPKTAVWELTLGCNLQCRHCGSRAGQARSDELSDDEMFALADELTDLGLERITLSGGEPTLHPRWADLGAYLVKQGVRVNMISNGLTWTPEKAKLALDAGFRSVAFSVDGFEESHDFIRGRKGSYEKVLEAFVSSRSVGLPISAVTTIYRNNLKELEPLKLFLAKEGVASWQLQIGNPAGNMRDNRELTLVPEDLLEIVPLLAAMRQEGGEPAMFIGDNIGYFGPHEEALRGTGKEIDFWLGCRAGMQVIGIESNGAIKGCLSLPSALNKEDRFQEGNVREKSLTDIWCNPDGFSYSRSHTPDRLSGFCRTCTYNEICRGGCLWTAFSHSGDTFDNPFCYYRVAVEKGLITP